MLRAIRNYFEETRAEAKKVIWPSRKDVLQSARNILWIVLFAALFVFLSDIAISGLRNFLDQLI